MKNIQTPVACTISATDAAIQGAEWSDLGGQLLSTEKLTDGVVMTFPTDIAESVMNLAAKEAECCGFLSITVDVVGQEVRLKVTSDDPSHLPMIAGMAEMIAKQ